MLFKLFLLSLLTSSLQALPGYNIPWGKDGDLARKPVEKSSSHPSLAVQLARQVILFHQKVISPVDGPRSDFYPCSSQYMKLAMIKHGFWKGYFMGCDRLMRENKDLWAYRTVIINGEKVKYDPPR